MDMFQGVFSLFSSQVFLLSLFLFVKLMPDKGGYLKGTCYFDTLARLSILYSESVSSRFKIILVGSLSVHSYFAPKRIVLKYL